MKINIDKQTLKAAVSAAVVAAILISGFNVNIDLTGESILNAVGLASALIGVFVLVKSQGAKDDD